MTKKRFCLTLLLLSPLALGGELAPPTYFDSAQVLPKGVRTLRYNRIMGAVANKFDSGGSVVPLGSPMNVGVTYREFVNALDSPLEKGLFKGYLKQNDKDMDSLTGNTTGSVNVAVDARVPVLGWGVTDTWMMVVAVPIITVKTHVDTGFVAHAGLQKITDQMTAEGQGFKAREMSEKTATGITDTNDKLGYEPFPPSTSHREETSIGDIRIANKVKLLSDKRYAMAFLNELTLPTGRRVDIHRAVDVPTGDGQFDLSFGVVGEYKIGSRTTLSSRLAYLWQAPDRVARRIPVDSKALLSSDLDGQVFRKLGDALHLSVGGNFDLDRGIKLNTQYSFQYKERDEYRGDQYQASRYDLLGRDSLQNLHALQLGVNYSTIDLFLKKKFPLPLDFNLASAIPLAGRNVTKDPTVIFEMGLFF